MSTTLFVFMEKSEKYHYFLLKKAPYLELYKRLVSSGQEFYHIQIPTSCYPYSLVTVCTVSFLQCK